MRSIPWKCLCLSLMAMVPLVAGCDRGSTDRAGTNPSTKKRAVKPPPAVPKGKGSIVGRVVFEGTPPKPRPINFGPDKNCAALHGDKKLFSESLVVNPNGTVKWMLVYIKGKVPGKYKPPAEPVVMDQEGCAFVPHVVAMMAGQKIELRNSDPFTHNVRVSPKLNSGINEIFTDKMARSKTIEHRELGMVVKCDIHHWMSAYIHALSNPFFAVTGDDGTFVLNGVPPGTYTVETWHETLKPQKQKVTVKADERKTVDFSFKSN